MAQRCDTCQFAPCRCEDLAAGHVGTNMRPSGWPLASDAAGVHPKQRKDAYDESVRLGVPTEFNAKGQAVFRDPAHRRRYCRAVGLHDRNGGYGDP